MKLNINALEVSLATNRGAYEARLHFGKGLNVIRAENTSGKSVIMNAILYGLGLELLVGKRGIGSTKPVMRAYGDYGGEDFHVLESYVELEIANADGQIVTIRRQVAGSNDERLVEVYDEPRLTGLQHGRGGVRPFYVGTEGAAQREHGFHRFLADFLNLDLPLVKRFSGGEVPLYVECIAPLMFIEQVRGWSGIQATLPQAFGIRNVAKVCVEHLLALDVIENEKRRTDISEEAQRIKDFDAGMRVTA